MFKIKNNIARGHLLTTVSASYNQLVELFGEHNSSGDGYKISHEFILEDIKTDKQVYIYDWKCTNLYEPEYPEPFADKDQEQLYLVGGFCYDTATKLVEYINRIKKQY